MPKQKVDKALTTARKLKITGTPSFFVAGKKLALDDLEAELEKAIQAAIEGE